MNATMPPLKKDDVEGAGILLTSVVRSLPLHAFDLFTILCANEYLCLQLSLIFYARYDCYFCVHVLS